MGGQKKKGGERLSGEDGLFYTTVLHHFPLPVRSGGVGKKGGLYSLPWLLSSLSFSSFISFPCSAPIFRYFDELKETCFSFFSFWPCCSCG